MNAEAIGNQNIVLSMDVLRTGQCSIAAATKLSLTGRTNTGRDALAGH